MRILAILLLLLNIGFLIWQQELLPWLPWQPAQFKPNNEPATAAADPNLLQLVLLEEAPQLAKTVDDELEIDSENEAELIEVENDFAAEVAEEIGELVAVAAEELMPDTVENFDENLLETQYDPIDETDTTVIDATESVAAELITAIETDNTIVMAVDEAATEDTMTAMLDKIDAAIPTAVNDATVVEVEPTATLIDTIENNNILPMQCYAAGPYTQQNTATTTENWFKQQPETIQTAVEARPMQILQHTWLYLTPFDNRQAAQQARQALQKKNIKDHAVINEGQYNNAISLGLYRDQLSVSRRLLELSEQGYTDIQIEKRYQDETRYWLNISLPANQQATILKRFHDYFKGSVLAVTECK